MNAPRSSASTSISWYKKAYNNGPLLLCLCTLFWAGNFVVGRGVVEDFPPILLAQLRWAIAAAILFPIGWSYLRREVAKITNWWVVIALSILGVSSFNTLAYIGLTTTTSVSGVVLQPAAPILILITGALMFGDRISPRQVIAVAISTFGVMTVAIQGRWFDIAELPFGRGEAIIALAFLVWAIYSNLLRHKPAIHDLAFLLLTFVVGGLCLLPFTLWELSTAGRVEFNAHTLLSLAYLGFFPSLVSYLFYNRGVHLIGAARAGMFIQLVPAYGVAMAWLLLGEHLLWYHAAGLMLILLALWLTYPRRQGSGKARR